ncbi:hypothetical protein AAWP21_05275 [Bacillus anthracis]|nr:hypothetical protein [Bacillus cereus]
MDIVTYHQDKTSKYFKTKKWAEFLWTILKRLHWDTVKLYVDGDECGY